MQPRSINWKNEDRPLVLVESSHPEGIITASFGSYLAAGRILILWNVKVEDCRRIDDGEPTVLDDYLKRDAVDFSRFWLMRCSGYIRTGENIEKPVIGGIIREFAPVTPGYISPQVDSLLLSNSYQSRELVQNHD